MEEPQKTFVVGIRFSKVGKLYHFDASSHPDILVDDRVVVETSRGWQLGIVAQILGWLTPDDTNGGWKPIERKATTADLMKRQTLEAQEEEILAACRRAVFGKDLSGAKIVSVEYSLDGIRCSILYSIEGEDKIDLRFLKNEVNKFNPQAQVELRQIGPRDVAKIISGMGACGLPTRCCSKFLTDFSSISIKMAKEQGISLTPAEITGMCGRLRCCLIYEYEHYHENRKLLPKRNKRVMTPVGEGRVIDVLPLKMAAIVDLPEVGYREFPNSDLIPMDQYDPQKHHKKVEEVKPVEVSQEKNEPEEKKTNEGDQNRNRRRGQHHKSQPKKGDGKQNNPKKGGFQRRNKSDQSTGQTPSGKNEQRRRRPNPKTTKSDQQ